MRQTETEVRLRRTRVMTIAGLLLLVAAQVVSGAVLWLQVVLDVAGGMSLGAVLGYAEVNLRHFRTAARLHEVIDDGPIER